MRIPLLAALALMTAGLQDMQAQELSREQIQSLLEQNLPVEPQFVAGQVIAKMRDDVSLSAAQLSPYGLETTARQLSGGEYVYTIPAAQLGAMATAAQARDATLAAVQAMGDRPDILYAQPNYILRILDTTPNDPRYAEQWHYFNNGSGPGESPGGINLPRAWDTSTGDASIVVSILDTGILPNHPDITGSPNLVAGFDMISDPSTANDGDGRDSDPTDPGDACPPQPSSWHGTHVAGTVGVGNSDNGTGVAGVNWNTSVQAVRVLGRCGGTIADINDGIRWAAGLPVPGVPNNATPARVISMSLGGSGACTLSPSTQSAINDAVAANAVVVVAAGNEASDASGFLPASCDNVITVAASDYRGHLVMRYSNFGATVEIMAPGGDVQRDDDGDGNPDGVLSMVQGGYSYFNGTSMATPHVSGVAALWLASDSSLTPAQLLAELQAAATPRDAAQCPQPCGAGLLSAIRSTAPPQLTLTVRLDPDKTLANGETTTAIATVRRGGAPEVGMTVVFATGDASIATIAPASAVTGPTGEATATVTGVSSGETAVTATANGVTASTPVKVPALSLIAIAILALLMAIVITWRRRFVRTR